MSAFDAEYTAFQLLLIREQNYSAFSGLGVSGDVVRFVSAPCASKEPQKVQVMFLALEEIRTRTVWG